MSFSAHFLAFLVDFCHFQPIFQHLPLLFAHLKFAHFSCAKISTARKLIHLRYVTYLDLTRNSHLNMASIFDYGPFTWCGFICVCFLAYHPFWALFFFLSFHYDGLLFRVYTMGAQTRGDEVVKPPKGFSNHLWPPKRVNFQNFSYIFFKNLQNFSTYFFLNFFENINILAIFRLTTSSSKIPPRGPKKVLNFTKNLGAWKFFLMTFDHLTPRGLKRFWRPWYLTKLIFFI